VDAIPGDTIERKARKPQKKHGNRLTKPSIGGALSGGAAPRTSNKTIIKLIKSEPWTGEFSEGTKKTILNTT